MHSNCVFQLLQVEVAIPELACGGTQSICHPLETHMLCLCCSSAETAENLLMLWNQPACKYFLDLILLDS